MRFLFRLVTSVFFIGLALHFFHSLGRRHRAENLKDHSRDGSPKRKVVESSVIEDESL